MNNYALYTKLKGLTLKVGVIGIKSNSQVLLQARQSD